MSTAALHIHVRTSVARQVPVLDVATTEQEPA